MTFASTGLNQHAQIVIEGDAELIAPRGKVRRPRVMLPLPHLHVQGAQYARLIEATHSDAATALAASLARLGKVETINPHIFSTLEAAAICSARVCRSS